jgi:hypothetical protein
MEESQAFRQAEVDAAKAKGDSLGRANTIDTRGDERTAHFQKLQKPIGITVIQQALLGFPLGIAIGVVFAIIFSLAMVDGRYYPVTPGLLNMAGSELAAVIVQTVLCGLFGTMWAGSSVIFQIESWSLTRQTLTHLAIAMPSSLVVALASAWVPLHLVAILLFIGIWILIYTVIWLSLTFYWRSQIKKLNSQL